jgi:hypothetical protein
MPSANSRFLVKRMADAYFGTGSFKFMLAAIPSETQLDTWDFRNDVSNEITGTGYTAGGVACTVTVGAVDTTNNRVAVTLSNLSPGWTTSTLTSVPGGWLYKDMGSAATDELATYVEFTAPASSTAGNFSVTFTTPLYVNA